MNKKAYSLTELIAVVAIIGIILLITIPVTKNMMRKNNEEKCTSYVSLIESSLKTYADMEMAKNGESTVTLQDLIDNEYIKSPDANLFDNSVSLSSYSFSITKTNGILTIPDIKVQFKISGQVVCCDKNLCTKNSCS